MALLTLYKTRPKAEAQERNESYLHTHLVSQADTGRQRALQDQNGRTAYLLDRTVLHTAPQEWGKSLLVVKTKR